MKTPNNAAKLDSSKRCAILAGHRLGITTLELAQHYGVSSNTVRAIASPVSKQYGYIRDRYEELGLHAFVSMYLDRDDEHFVTNGRMLR